jgi:hypothetical protein
MSHTAIATSVHAVIDNASGEVIHDVNKMSAREIGYALAKNHDAIVQFANWGRTHVEGWPDKKAIPKAIKSEFCVGVVQRWAEKIGTIDYVMDNGEYRKVAADEKFPDGKVQHVSVPYAVGLDKNTSYRALNKRDPKLFEIVKNLRDKVARDCSDRWSDLLRTEKEAQKADGTAAKVARTTKTIAQRYDEFFAKMDTANATAVESGSPMCYEVNAYRKAVGDFRRKLKAILVREGGSEE